MIAVIILAKPFEGFSPLIDKNVSASFLPVNESGSILSLTYSWINGYFSKDKIFVVCKEDEQARVKSSCKGIDESNMIIEPEKINYSVSVFFASMILNKIDPNETVMFYKAGLFFPQQFKMGNWMYAAEEMTEKGHVVIPTVLLNRGDKDIDYIDAGRHAGSLKSFDFFNAGAAAHGKDKVKIKRFFGRQGRFLNIIMGKSEAVIQLFMRYSIKTQFFVKLGKYFASEKIEWKDIKDKYKNRDNEVNDLNVIMKNNNFLIIFLDTMPINIHNWGTFLARFGTEREKNILAGKVTAKNCSNVICFNYDKENISIENMEAAIVYKKNGSIIIKSLLE